MSAYIAQIIYRISCEGVATEQYEEQWRMVFSHDYDQALNEARRIAQAEETSFTDRHGRQVQWRLVAVKDLQQVEPEHGVLLFSQVREASSIPAPVWMEP